MAKNLERQADEIKVLQAVFMNDFQPQQSTIPAAKKRWSHEMKLELRPQVEGDICNMQLTFFVRFPPQYPDKIPDIQLQDIQGLSSTEIDALKKILYQQMESSLGEVMILELALTIQTFLNDNVRPATKSFYEEMLFNRKKQEEDSALRKMEKNVKLKEKEEKERKHMEEEIAKKVQEIKESEKKVEKVNVNNSQLPETVPSGSFKVIERDDEQLAEGDIGSEIEQIEMDGESESSERGTNYNKNYKGLGHSRLQSEFDILMSLGKGGFGEVLKARNKLDRRLYAIKRIPLDPRSQQLTKKITREVKLLSRLNHENVVRYYNAWLETGELLSNEKTSSVFESSSKSGVEGKPNVEDSHNRIGGYNSVGLVDNVEKLAPPQQNESCEWSVTSSNKPVDEESEDENLLVGTIFPFEDDDDSDSIIFDAEEDGDSEATAPKVEFKDVGQDKDKAKTDLRVQYLFIQMEYCEKRTLRHCINDGLHLNVNRVWRLFREMIEGLVHLHEQGIIHRDLKPVNIFLDSKDRVKIGDFGLATTDIFVKKNMGTSKIGTIETSLNIFKSESACDQSELTANVGTALYVSPEVKATGGKLHYNQKVDSYSLGIIFFEMCYKPLTTTMERISVLTDLRKPAIIFPVDFNEFELSSQAYLIKWLLKHDPSKRPTTKELLKSEHLPPPQMEETEMNELLRSTLANPQSKSYHHMIDALFTQPFSQVQDLTYDSDTCKTFATTKLVLVQKYIYDTMERVFQCHGAVKFSTHLLQPKCPIYKNNEQYVCLMDHSGGLVGLPCDLRVPFARFLARSNVQAIKRYSLEKVYQEKKIFGLHPKEMTECAFDIVTPSQTSLIPESELLAVVSQIVNEFPALRERNYYFRLNHTSLIKSVLLYCGIPEEKHLSVQLCLRDYQHKKSLRRQFLDTRCGVTFTEQSASNFFTLLDFEGKYQQVQTMLRRVVKSKGLASSLAKQGLHELETIISYAESLNVKIEMKVSIGQMYNPAQYNGFIFQLLFEHTKKKRLVGDVLAAGGRYDQLIKRFKSYTGEEDNVPSAVGVSLAFEKIVSAVVDTPNDISSHDVVVCSVGHKPMLKERLSIVKDLWAAGIRAEVLYDSIQKLEDVHLYCRNLNITYIVCLKDGDGGTVRIRWLERDKNMEKKVFIVDMVDFLLQRITSSKVEPIESVSNTCKVGSNNSSNHTESHALGSVSRQTLNYIFINQDIKLPGNTKRRYEIQIFGKVTTTWPWLPSKSIDVVIFNLDDKVVSTIASHLVLNEDQQAFERSIGTIIEKIPRHKAYLIKIMDEIQKLRFEKKVHYFVIYGMKDDSMKLMV